ncbi:MAG TPA: HlyD family efflux transporter periplasmic adaptor subunit [Bacteroidales bacterium]|nr:HlyD family efflux transporter periplasmic adaptor subunit [Bacteroidales bacterium]
MKKISFISLTIFAVILVSCSAKNNQSEENQIADSLIAVSAEQFKAMNMAIGNPVKVTFASDLTVQGIIEPSPNAKAYISSPIGGVIKMVKVTSSSPVKRGQVLIVIEGPEVMNAQTAFVEAFNQHLVAKSNYERLAQLAQNGITSQRELIQAEGEYRILDAKLHSYKILLTRIGLNPDVILKGDFSGDAYLVSPIEGVVSRIETAMGKPVTTDEPVAEVIDHKNLLLKFYVFMNQVNLVKLGQKVEIVLPGSTNTIYGNVISVGLDANTENKAVECFASISQPSNAVLVSGMRVSAKVITEIVNGWALPVTALHESDNDHHVFALKKSDSHGYWFKKVPLQVGLVQDTIVQIFDSTLTNVLLRGEHELTIEQ